MAKLKVRQLEDYSQTVSEIWKMADNYWFDLWTWGNYSLEAFFSHVHSLPYVEDPAGVEFVTRPGLTVSPDYRGFRDCDDKAVLFLAWARARFVVRGERNVPRVVVSGRGETPHHVYVEFFRTAGPVGIWIPAEATYPDKGGLGNRLWPEKFRRVFEYPAGKNSFFGPHAGRTGAVP